MTKIFVRARFPILLLELELQSLITPIFSIFFQYLNSHKIQNAYKMKSFKPE